MGEIRKQIAKFFAILALLYAGGVIAGQFVETGRESHAERTSAHDRPSSSEQPADAGEPSPAARAE